MLRSYEKNAGTVSDIFEAFFPKCVFRRVTLVPAAKVLTPMSGVSRSALIVAVIIVPFFPCLRDRAEPSPPIAGAKNLAHGAMIC